MVRATIGESDLCQAGEKDCSLDPRDWGELRALAHRMLDDALDDIEGIRDRPLWRPMARETRGAFDSGLPTDGESLDQVYADYLRLIAPYNSGNRHPRFFGWVQGGGNVAGMLAGMLAAGLNNNCGGRDHAAILCERQVIAWAAQMLGLPPGSSGLVLSGASMANLVGVLVARTAALGVDSRRRGVGARPIVGYASAEAHLCVARAFDLAGIGSDALRLIGCDAQHRMRMSELEERIEADRKQGMQPFVVVGTAGTVDVGAIDELGAIAALCAREKLWFHVDAALGAPVLLSPRLRSLFAGIERADSVAFDWHKLAQVPYDAGCIVVRDRAAHRAAFARAVGYLGRSPRGLAAGTDWPVDFGPELSRSFRALSVWMTVKAYGAARLGGVAEQCCALAQRLASAIDQEPALERVAPVALNVVCFRDRRHADSAQSATVEDLQLRAGVVLSMTTIGGRPAMRAAVVNHRTRAEDIDAIVGLVLGCGFGCGDRI